MRPCIVANTIRTALLVAIAAACASCATPPAPRMPAGPWFRLMSYNVERGAESPRETLRAIRTSNPDVAVLIGSDPVWDTFVQDETSALYGHRIHRFDDRFDPASGITVLSRWSVRSIRYFHPRDTPYMLWLIQVEAPTGPVQIICAHLQKPRNTTCTGSRPVRGTGGRKEALRYAMAYTEARHPVLVVGDFGEGPGGTVPRWLESRGFASALQCFAPGEATEKPRWRFQPWKRRSDHLFSSPHLEVYGAGIIKDGGSRHYPVWAVFGTPESAMHAKTQEGQR